MRNRHKTIVAGYTKGQRYLHYIMRIMATKSSTKIQEQEELRNSIDGKKLLKEINKIVDELLTLNRDVKDAKNTRQRPTHVADTIVRTDARRKVLETVLKTKKGMLDKLVSDRKAVEVSGPGGKDLFEGLFEALRKK